MDWWIFPVACTLSLDSAADRVDEWRRFLLASVDVVERPGEHRLRLRLRPSSDVLLAAVGLSQSEKACCPFFQFSIDLKANERWLVVTVPADATDILTGFAELLRDDVRL